MADLCDIQLQPLLFTPIYKEILWGGDMLASVLGRELPQTTLPVGEAWEIVDRDADQSVVSDGPLKGVRIAELMAQRRKDFAGSACRSDRFPLLVKIIDAGQRLSLQVHPDEAACAILHGAEPKTEMWYILQSKEGSKIFAGLNSKCTRMDFQEHMSGRMVEDYLQTHDSQPGDAYYIHAGTVHAIGAGNLLLEVQQNSDTTYRISDWGRVAADGKPRKLHVDEAMKCINFLDRSNPKIPAASGSAARNRKFPIIQKSNHFQVETLRLVEDWSDKTNGSTFHLLTAIDNPVSIQPEGRGNLHIPLGRTCLVPASTGAYVVSPHQGRESTIVKTMLPS